MFEVDPTPAKHIERLEAQIDELREAIRRSRRLVVGKRHGDRTYQISRRPIAS
jgi:hypothetical protein